MNSFVGRSRENIIIVILCGFLIYVWFSYNSRAILELEMQKKVLSEELEVLTAQKEPALGLCFDACLKELADYKETNEYYQKYVRLQQRITELQQVKPIGCPDTPAPCSLEQEKAQYATKLSDLEQRISATREVIKSWQKRLTDFTAQPKPVKQPTTDQQLEELRRQFSNQIKSVS